MLISLAVVICKFRGQEVCFDSDRYYEDVPASTKIPVPEKYILKPTVYVMDVATFESTNSPCSAQFAKTSEREGVCDNS